MTSKRLNFPSMGDPDPSDSSDLFIQNESGEYTKFIPDDTDDDYSDDWEDLDTDKDESKDLILDGELLAYDRVKKIIGGDYDSFMYFPSEAEEEVNQQFSMAHLQKDWGSETQKNIGFANFFYRNFLDEGLRKEAERTGIASHYLMVQTFYKLAKQAEALALRRKRGESEGVRTMKFKGMDKITIKKLEEWCKDAASRAYSQAKDAIIQMHGGISHG